MYPDEFKIIKCLHITGSQLSEAALEDMDKSGQLSSLRYLVSLAIMLFLGISYAW